MILDKNKLILTVILASIVTFPVHAENCVITGKSELINLIQKTFKWSLWMAGLLAFGALILGGFMYVISGGNKNRVEQGKKYMTGAFLGLIILLTSVLLLRTINPQLLRWKGIKEPPDTGVCFYNKDSSAATSVRCCYAKGSQSMPEGFEVKRATFRSPKEELYGIYSFSTTSWEGDCNYKENAKGSGITKATFSTPPKSFYMDWNKPGVYLYKNEEGSSECDQASFPEEPFKRYQSSNPNLGDFDDKVSSIKFRNLGCKDYGNYKAPRVSYAAILHSEIEFEGKCSLVGVDFNQNIHSAGACVGTARDVDNLNNKEIGEDSSSVTVFNYSFASAGSPSGRVTFYEKVGQEGNHFSITTSDINGAENLFWSEEVNYPIGGQSWANVQKVGPGNDTMEQIMSMKIDGDFMVMVGQDSGIGNRYSFGERCEAIKKSVSNFKKHDVLNDKDDDQINAIGIAPIKN